jgi:hypothetical protein
MLLRLKGKAEEETLDEAVPHRADTITADDAFPEHGVVNAERDEPESEPDRFPSTVRGLSISAACFVPTFLAVFLGLPYLVGLATPARTPRALSPEPAATSPFAFDRSASATPPRSEAIRDPFAAPGVLEPPVAPGPDPREMSRLDDTRESSRNSGGESAAPSAAEPPAPAATPDLPPPPLQGAQPRAPEPRTPEPPRQVAAPRPAPEPRPVPEPRRPGPDWTPAAAFTDREAASRLAGSIQQQGYPVEIRQDRSSMRPWVVWIGARPRDGERRR